MIKCAITIKEVPGKGFYIDMIPDQSQATPQEIGVATCLDLVFRAVGQYLMRKGERGEVIDGESLEIVNRIVAHKIREFES